MAKKDFLENCEEYTRPFYLLHQAAYSWCGLTDDEYEDFRQLEVDDYGKLKNGWSAGMSDDGYPQMPSLPCFKKRLEHLIHAVAIGELPHGRDGTPVQAGEQVAKLRRTVAPEDLKIWMESKFPNEKPDFLFNQLEKKELLDTQQLLGDNERLRQENQELSSRLDVGRAAYRKLQTQARNNASNIQEPAKKSENLQLEIIQLFAGTMFNSGLSDSPFTDAEKIIKKLAAANKSLPCGKETLAKYLKANR
jgi:hypothetical protein